MYRTVKLIIAALVLTSVLSAEPEVMSISPASHSISNSRSSDITIDFSTTIDPATITEHTFMVFGRFSGAMGGELILENSDTRLRFVPEKNFFAGEWVTVSLSKHIQDMAAEPLAHGYTWQFWTAVATESMGLEELERISVREPGEPHIQTYGAHAGDLNEDGYSDYLTPNENTNDVRVFLNDGSGNYEDFTIFDLPGASRPSTNESADFNHDGHLDIAIGSTSNSSVNVLLGDGTGSFLSLISYSAGTQVRGLAVMDLDADGYTDIVTTNRVGNNLSMLMNNGDGTFAAPINMDGQGFGETACMAADANNDGIMDLFVGSLNSNEIAIFLGDGEGNLIFSAETGVGGFGPWMIATGDVDADGNVDVVTANSNNQTVGVIRGDGQGGLMDAETYNTGDSFPLAIDLGDLDGDGDLDMIVSNFGGTWRLWENDGSGTFINAQDLNASAAASCAVFHDRDGDGDMDVTGIDELDDLLFIFDQITVGIDPATGEKITDFHLEQNYPNPFNPTTNFEFRISDFGFVNISIYDVQGQLVKTIVNREMLPGAYEASWDGLNSGGSAVSSGVYLYKLKTGSGFVQSRKMVLLR